MTTVDEIPVLTDPRLYTAGDPREAWARLRRDAPVSWQCHDRGHQPFWAVATHAAGMEVLTDWRRFSSAGGTLLRPNLSDPFPGQGKMLTMTDPPRHTALRKVVSGLFTPRRVAATGERARSVARALVADAVAAGRCDFVTAVASRLPMAVVGELLGVREEDVADLAELTATAADNITDIAGVTAQVAHLEVLDYYAQMIESRRGGPGAGDIVSTLVAAQADGMDISDDEIILTCDNIVVAAGETTRHAAASGLLALLGEPAQMDALRSGAADPAEAVEELLRWAAPVRHIMRTAREDTEVMGVPIVAGEVVSAWISSMNHDEGVFDQPHLLRLDRRPNRHATFGGGMHFCLGAALSRMMMRALFAELLAATTAIAPDGEPVHLTSHVVNGLRSLPVVLHGR